jgi:glycogen operon protein
LTLRIWPGLAQPLGAGWDGQGVNFALFSEHAERVELCLYDSNNPRRETARVALPEKTNHVWHGYMPDIRPSQLYGYRVYGPNAPAQGHRFNPKKLLLDPYARAIVGQVQWAQSTFGYAESALDGDLAVNEEDSADDVPRCMVLDSAFTWGDDHPPRTPWSRTLIYECHVKGMTLNHPDIPPTLRGTFLGLVSGRILEHLLSLGVTSVELLPVHQAVNDQRLLNLGLVNYWGYNTLGFFSPDARFSTGSRGQQVTEFKTMVKAFHRAGIEVILDVVYNHTGEGNELGPTLCFRGIDNASYYRLPLHDRRRTEDFTGCGNSLNLLHPRVLQLVLDSLRYWVVDMHVDGFRFDLATTLARDPTEFNSLSRFFMMIQQDPVLSGVKLIAEPWDLGPGGYRLGGFPPGWSEWNGRYRDCVRRFWRGDESQIPELASRLSGSSDLFQSSGRGPLASINFVTCHDGFTLHDLVSYERKHNLANGEDNRDGSSENHSRNWGIEGGTSAPAIRRLRERIKRNMLATLAFSQGVPLLTAGDEMGRSQRGNNNAYCQDNLTSWVDWKLSDSDRELLDFTRELFRIARNNPVLRRRKFFNGRIVDSSKLKDVTWLRFDGHEMLTEDWANARARSLGMLIHGGAQDQVDELGQSIVSPMLLLVLNASNRSKMFVLPRFRNKGTWKELVNTAQASRRSVREDGLAVAPHTLTLLSYERMNP